MKLNEISDNPGATKNRIRVGRGIGSGKGKQGGRGGKGQTARSGYANKGFEGGQMPLHRRLPKRGFNNPNAKRYVAINLARVQAVIDAGRLDATQTVDAAAMIRAGLFSNARDGVRLLGQGEITSAVTFQITGASKSAVAAVERVGGKVNLPAGAAVEAS